MDKTIYLDSIDQYNKLYGLETLHPLVSIINLNEAPLAIDTVRINYRVYAIYLKIEKACDIKYGRQKYDYEEGTIVFFAPGQTAETKPTNNQIKRNNLPSGLTSRHITEQNDKELHILFVRN